MDISRVGWPFSDNFVMIPAAAISELAMLAARMNASGDKQYIHITQSLRGATLKQSLKKCYERWNQSQSS